MDWLEGLGWAGVIAVGGVLHLGPGPAFESVDNWRYLHIKPHWLAIPNKKEDNFLATML